MKRGWCAAIAAGVFVLLASAMEARMRAVRLPLQVEAGYGFDLNIETTSPETLPPGLTSITYSVSAPAGITVIPVQPTTLAPAFGQAVFRINTNVAMTPGRVQLTVTGVGSGAPGFVVAPAFFSFDVTPARFHAPSVTPNTLSFIAGGAATFTARVDVLQGYPSTITVTPMAPPGMIISPAQAVLPSATSTTPSALFTVTSNVPGTTTFPVEFRSSTGQQQTVPLTVTVNPPLQTDFAMSVSPPVVSLSAGETRQITLTITPAIVPSPIRTAGQFPSNPVAVSVVAGNGVTVTPSQFTIIPPGAQTLTVTVSPQSSGIVPVIITGISGANRHTARADVAILPAINAVVPASVVAPSISQTVRIAGTNFAPGGTVISRSPGVVVERTTVYSPTLAEAVITVLPGAPIGALRFDFRNPEGSLSVRGSTLFVYPQEAIGAPLGVSTAAIVYPVDGTIVGSGQNVFPRALLATSGTGTVTGHWAIDGMAFGHFNVTTSAGAPVQVRAQAPIPPTAVGRHELSLVIESPRLTQAPSVSLETAVVSLPPITIYEPLDRAIVEGPPRIRWSIVPGASSYDLELRQLTGDKHDPAPRHVHTTESEWRPKDLGAGTYSIRVRPIYPIDVPGEPTPWLTAVILPDKASLRIDGASERRISWSGGLPGMLYRVEFLGDGGRCFDALTFASDYRLPDSITWRDCSAVRVQALAPSGALLGTSDVRGLTPVFATAASLSREAPPLEIVERFPASRTKTVAAAAIGARWRGASGGDVTLIVDGIDVTSVSARERQAIAYNALLPLRGGTHVAALASGGKTDEWTFDVAQDPAAAPPVEPANTPTYVLEPNGSVVWAHATTGKESAEEHLALSSEGEAGDSAKATGTKGKGDLAWVGTSDPNRVVPESRNMIVSGRLGGDTFGSASAGYVSPDFADGTSFLTPGSARTGVVAHAGSAYGTLSYYLPVDPSIHGFLSASPDELKVRSFALALPENPHYSLRVIGMQVDEPASVSLTIPGSSTRTYGIFGGYTLGPAAAFILETAHGTIESPAGGRRGSATRIGVTGTVKGAAYTLNLRDVDPNFVNPANRGLTSNIADRQGGDLTISRTFGKSTLGFSAGREDQGRASDSKLPHASSSKAGFSFSTTFAPQIALTTSANAAHDTADVASGSTLPRTDRLLTCSTATLSETFTKISLSQKIDWSRLDDRIDPLSNTEVKGLAMSASGDLVSHLNLSSSASYTRTQATPLKGMTNDWMVQFSPTISMSRLKVTPTVLISASSNDVIHSNTRTEGYGTIVQWTPPWRADLLTGNLSGTETRTSNSSIAAARTTTRAYQASVTVHLKKTRGLPMFDVIPPPPAVTSPPSPVQPGGGPVNVAMMNLEPGGSKQ